MLNLYNNLIKNNLHNMKKFVVIGSGRQGIAVAYDLLRNTNNHVTMVDISDSLLEKALNS